jgi:alpha-glucosidase
MQELIHDGISGFWTDMNEPATWGQQVPDVVDFDMEGRGGSHKEAHNLYGFQMARATYEGAKMHAPAKRPFVLSRAGFSGIQRYAALWTGDNRSDDRHMLAGVRLLNAMGLAGQSFVGMDIGGFVGDADRDLFARWVTIGAFSPLCRLHTMVDSKDAEPWAYGEKNEAISRNYINLRYQLLPYIYSAFAEAATTGMPVQRSMALTNPMAWETYEFDLQYWFGPSLLVSPNSAHQVFTRVYLPACADKWYHLYDDTRWLAGTPVAGSPTDILPVFVPPSAIIPMQSKVQHTGQECDGVLELHIYDGSQPNSYELYWDEGEGYDFEEGKYLKRKIGWLPSSKSIVIATQEGTYPSPWHTIRIVLHGMEHVQTAHIAHNPNAPTIGFASKYYRFLEPLPAFDPFGNDQTVHQCVVCVGELPWSDKQIVIVLGP